MKRPHYAWAVCFACALQLFCIWGICATAFPMFYPYLMESAHMTNAQISLIPTIRMLFNCLGISLSNFVFRKFGLRLVAAVSLLGCAAGFFMFGVFHSWYLFYLAAAVIGIFYGLGTNMLVSLLIPRWFHSHTALALGICSSSSGLATVILPPVATAILTSGGLRAAIFFEGAIVALSAVVVFLLIRSHPRDLHLRAYEDGKEGRSVMKAAPKEGVHTRRSFLMAGIAMGLYAGIACAGTSQVSMIYSTGGYAPAQVALILTLYGAALTVGKIVYGRLCDTIGNRRTSAAAYAIEVVGGVCMCLAANKVLGTAGILLFGFGLPLSTVGIPLLAEDVCEEGRYEQTIKTLNMIMYICGLILTPLPGIIADLTGSYVPSFALFTVLTAMAGVTVELAYHKKKPAAGQSGS